MRSPGAPSTSGRCSDTGTVSAIPSGSASTRPAGPVSLRAFADESIRTTPTGSFFVFAATVVREDRCEAVRHALGSLLLRGQASLHWHDEDDPRRRKIAAAVAEVGANSLVVVGAPVVLTKQERARRQVLGRLLWELDRRQVEHALLESRHLARDAHDLRAIGGFRNAGLLSRRLRVDHGKAKQEPLLWLPDAVAGAVGDDRCGAPDCRDLLQDVVEVQELTLD